MTTPQKNNVPALRFPEFLDQWDEKKLGYFFPKIRNGFVGTATPHYVENGIPYLQGKNIKAGKIKPNGLVLISEDFHFRQQKSQLQKDDILMVQSGHVGECALVTDKYNNGNCHALIVLSPDIQAISKFFVYYFYSPVGKKKIKRVKTGNTIAHILTSDLKPLLMRVTNKPEQQKIAAFLSSVDKKIAQLDQKKQLWEQYKKGMMQKLFSQDIRFKDENGQDFPDWEKKELAEILDYKQPTPYLVKNTEYNDSFSTPVLTAGKTFLLGYTKEITGIFEDNLPIIIFDDFTTASKFVDFPFKAKSSAMKMLISRNDDVNMSFIYSAIKKIRFPLGEHKRYWISEYQWEKIPYPCQDEQQKIANFLSSIDKKIDLITTELEQAKTFKKGLLQQMFV